MITTIERLRTGGNALATIVSVDIPIRDQAGQIRLYDYMQEQLKSIDLCNYVILGFMVVCQNAAKTRTNGNGGVLLSDENLAKLFVNINDKNGNCITPGGKVSLELFAVDPKTCCDPNFQNVYWTSIGKNSCITVDGTVTDDEHLKIYMNICPTV